MDQSLCIFNGDAVFHGNVKLLHIHLNLFSMDGATIGQEILHLMPRLGCIETDGCHRQIDTFK